MAAEEKLTTPTTPNPTPPITTHRLQLSTLWLSNGRSLVRQLLTKDSRHSYSQNSLTLKISKVLNREGLEPKGATGEEEELAPVKLRSR